MGIPLRDISSFSNTSVETLKRVYAHAIPTYTKSPEEAWRDHWKVIEDLIDAAFPSLSEESPHHEAAITRSFTVADLLIHDHADVVDADLAD